MTDGIGPDPGQRAVRVGTANHYPRRWHDPARRDNRDAGRIRPDDDLTLRRARTDDARDLERITQLDSTRPPHGDVLVAELHGEILAWLELETGRTAADPFRHTAALVLMLLLRAEQLGSTEDPGRVP